MEVFAEARGNVAMQREHTAKRALAWSEPTGPGTIIENRDNCRHTATIGGMPPPGELYTRPNEKFPVYLINILFQCPLSRFVVFIVFDFFLSSSSSSFCLFVLLCDEIWKNIKQLTTRRANSSQQSLMNEHFVPRLGENDQLTVLLWLFLKIVARFGLIRVQTFELGDVDETTLWCFRVLMRYGIR